MSIDNNEGIVPSLQEQLAKAESERDTANKTLQLVEAFSGQGFADPVALAAAVSDRVSRDAHGALVGVNSVLEDLARSNPHSLRKHATAASQLPPVAAPRRNAGGVVEDKIGMNESGQRIRSTISQVPTRTSVPHPPEIQAQARQFFGQGSNAAMSNRLAFENRPKYTALRQVAVDLGIIA